MESLDGYKARQPFPNTSQLNGVLRILSGRAAFGFWRKPPLESPSSWKTVRRELIPSAFARAPYTDDGATVHPVLDSSRYFVLRVQDPATGNKAYIGIGFTDRSGSFDFNVALQDYTKRKNAPAKLEEEAKVQASTPKVDYSLKEGQTFKISIPGSKGASSSSSASVFGSGGSSGGGGAVPLLPPPPPGGTRRR
ncbi:SubName: Full=Uncharacterized protein {ECO:0000313/EMBL:CCA67120.1} [Serendipita indica DSM 11827]|nr:SubName: Full=Uncharacterized protein {ECO:0000313/EMBL:CCA67120.1} [Serendipita indica DSM 11827]